MKMKIALIGFGKMGHQLEAVARRLGGFEVCSIIDSSNADATHREISRESIGDADVCLDFTTPTAVVSNVRKIASLGKNMVVGTTGWYDSLVEVQKIIQESGIGLIYAPNFSLGVSLKYKLLNNSGNIFKRLGYKPRVVEIHHVHKLDSPSGTAKNIVKILEKMGFT